MLTRHNEWIHTRVHLKTQLRAFGSQISLVITLRFLNGTKSTRMFEQSTNIITMLWSGMIHSSGTRVLWRQRRCRIRNNNWSNSQPPGATPFRSTRNNDEKVFMTRDKLITHTVTETKKARQANPTQWEIIPPACSTPFRWDLFNLLVSQSQETDMKPD